MALEGQLRGYDQGRVQLAIALVLMQSGWDWVSWSHVLTDGLGLNASSPVWILGAQLLVMARPGCQLRPAALSGFAEQAAKLRKHVADFALNMCLLT